MIIKYFGISNLLFDDGKTKILFDCSFSRPSLKQLVFSKINTNSALVDEILAAAKVTKIDSIFISHSHYDHALDLGYVANKFNSHIYGTSSTLNIARGQQIKENKMTEFSPFSTYIIGDFSIKVLPSVHSKPFFFNNDLGQKITEPLTLPAREWQFKEGGSFDFLLKHHNKIYLIRPSFGYVNNELKDIKADYLFLATTTFSNENRTEQRNFLRETIDQVKPKIIIPLHWDNFVRPLNKSTEYLPFAKRSNAMISDYCKKKKIKFVQMPPLSEINL